MEETSPLVPLIGITLALLGLIGLIVFAFVRLRHANRPAAKPDRLSEEAFAAMTIQAALSGRSAPGGPVTPLAAPGAAPATPDGAVLDALPAPILVSDESGVVRRINAAARARLGLTVASTGHPHRSVLAPWPTLADAFARAHTSATPIEPVPVPLEDGAVVTAVLTRWAPAGARGGVVAVLLPQAAEGSPGAGLRSAIGAAVADDVSRLASGLAHELANSLTTVHGYVHLVDRTTLRDADRSAFDQIATSAESMLRTVEAFRALVRPLRLSPAAFAPAAAVEAAIALARQETGAAADAVELESRPCDTVTADRVVIEEAIAAVVANAIEASRQLSPAPPVTVRVGPAAGGGAEIVVADRGPGVSEELRRRVGQPFFSDKADHAGLGLARALQVIGAHAGAALTLTHPPSGGLTVTIVLPR
jgi:signal transduction histidine kinase